MFFILFSSNAIYASKKIVPVVANGFIFSAYALNYRKGDLS